MGSMSVENHFVGQQGRAEELAGIPAAAMLSRGQRALAARASFPLLHCFAPEQMNHC